MIYDLHRNTLVDLYICGQVLHLPFIFRCITFPTPLYSTQKCSENSKIDTEFELFYI